MNKLFPDSLIQLAQDYLHSLGPHVGYTPFLISKLRLEEELSTFCAETGMDRELGFEYDAVLDKLLIVAEDYTIPTKEES